MSRHEGVARAVACRCGGVELEARGVPIVTEACHCSSCQKAGQQFEALPGAGPVLGSDGGTDFALFRKDRVRCVKGQDALAERRLMPASKTRRVVATCCNSPMFLEFNNGHWLSIYNARLPADTRPDVELRTMTVDRRAGVEFSDGMPSYARHSGRFMWKLLSAWAAMRFRSPKVDYVRGEPDVQG